MTKSRDLANAATALNAVTATELGFVDGVTSAIQTQLDAKALPANVINNTFVDAKGDLISATANDTPARLAVGANGDTIVADSSAATGLRYQVGNGLAQGVINGGFDIWQRSTSTSGNGYTSTDRFYVFGSGTSTFSRESSVVPTGLQYSFKHLAGATTSSSLAQVIETSNAILYAGQTVTLSMYASASTATSMSLQLAFSTATDTGIGGSWTDITATGSSTFAAGTGGAFTRGSVIFAVPSTAKSLRVTLAVLGNIANTVAVYYAGAQLEVGSVATQFRRAGGTIQGELAACQRYYFRTASTQSFGWFGSGIAGSTTSTSIGVPLPTTMRTVPSLVDFSTLALCDVAGSFTVTTCTLDTNITSTTFGTVTATALGLTQFRPYYLRQNASSAGFIGFSAEL